ncbi:hypothetical protein M5K25_016163 [Dendrobium thyrsiflorum]|uniref:Transposase MuDR plant domain-containing protein n=1 Tax=Dendrobium thyrsiflorum TaxID=117978 RepID=A0ABD0URD6_DENTH
MERHFILMYGGQLSLDEKYSPTYVGGSYRPLQVGVKTKLDQLKMRVLKALKYDMSKYTVNLVCRLPLGNEFIGSAVEDDEVCEMVLSHAIGQILVLYVELKEISAENVVAEQITSEVHASFSFDGVTKGGMMNRSIVPQCAERKSFCQAVAGTFEIPSGNLDDGYETMSSGSTDPCPDDGDDESNYNLDEANVDMNNEIHNIVQRYCYTNIGTAKGIHVNNEFVKTYSTTREWDEDVANDSEYVGNQVEQEFSIPIELMEGMCFSNKEDLKFALQGLSIINNVEYIKKMTVVCAQNGRSGIPCIWRLHAGVSKRLGGIWKISSMKNQHTCATPIIATGHRQCNSQFISYFILPSIRRHMDLKPREIIGQIEAKFNIKDARRKAVKIVFGSWEESYQCLQEECISLSIPLMIKDAVSNIRHRVLHELHDRSIFTAFNLRRSSLQSADRC